MVEKEKKPFWVSDVEKSGLENVPQCNVDVASAVPELSWVDRGSVVGAYVVKDGLLIYHIYKKDRKEVFDASHEEMERIRNEVVDRKELDRLQNEVSMEANAHLAQIPWWPNILNTLETVFSAHFQHQPHKITYYPEVDSCSVILPEPVMPGALAKEHLEGLFDRFKELG